MNLTLKTATHADIHDVWMMRLEMQRWEPAPWSLRKDLSERSIAALHCQTMAWLLDANTCVFLVHHHEDPVGYIVLASGKLMGHGDGATVRVDGWYHRPGYDKAGRMLAMAAGRLIKKAGIQFIQGCVLESNETMQEYLETHHFQPVGRIYQREVT